MNIHHIFQAIETRFERKAYDHSVSRWETASDRLLFFHWVMSGLISFIFWKKLNEYGLPFLEALFEASFAEVMNPTVMVTMVTLFILANVSLFFTLQSLSAFAVLRKREFGA